MAAILCAALIGGAITLLPELSRAVDAGGPPNGDRLDDRSSPGCDAGWPYYGADCLRDLRRPEARARPVRVIAQPERSGQ